MSAPTSPGKSKSANDKDEIPWNDTPPIVDGDGGSGSSGNASKQKRTDNGVS
jgi:hypothetical protein